MVHRNYQRSIGIFSIPAVVAHAVGHYRFPFGSRRYHHTARTHTEGIHCPAGICLPFRELVFGMSQLGVTCIVPIHGVIYRFLRVLYPSPYGKRFRLYCNPPLHTAGEKWSCRITGRQNQTVAWNLLSLRNNTGDLTVLCDNIFRCRVEADFAAQRYDLLPDCHNHLSQQVCTNMRLGSR